ncbi:MAG: tyrosine-type recombinase/integrase [Gammaproteobacteria bacterium]|jgi:integrase
MGRKRPTGLYKRGPYYRIDKSIRGIRINESTGTGNLEEAERYLEKRITEVRNALYYGQTPEYTFSEAATRYLKEYMNNKSIGDDASRLKGLLPYIGNKTLNSIHDGTMQPYIEDLQDKGRKSKTVNNGLELVRRILRKAATKWRDNLTNKQWITSMPVIENVNWNDGRIPYPISWVEQRFLISELTEHLIEPTLLALHTGCREQEICQLRWEWEVEVTELGMTVFVLPSWLTKNGVERIVVLNSVAQSVINSQRGKHPSRVFTYQKGRESEKVTTPLDHIYGSGWKAARQRAADQYEKEMQDDAPWGYRNLRVHDLRHTFGRRLRAAGVNKETRSDLFGHKGDDITTHYSAAEIKELVDAVDKLADKNLLKIPPLTLVRAVAQN